MSSLVVPVVRVPSCARGPPRVFVYCTCTTELYCTTVLYSRYIKNDDHHERTTVEIPFKIKDGVSFVVRSFVSDVYFWTDPYMGREVFSALFVLSHTRRITGTSTATGTGTTRRTRAEIPTTHLPCAAANS